MARKKKGKRKTWICICPVCEREATSNTFSCTTCKPPQWVHFACGGYTSYAAVVAAAPDERRCNNCKKESSPSTEHAISSPESPEFLPCVTQPSRVSTPRSIGGTSKSPEFLPCATQPSRVSTPRSIGGTSKSSSIADSVMFDDDEQCTPPLLQFDEVHECSNQNNSTFVAKFTPLDACCITQLDSTTATETSQLGIETSHLGIETSHLGIDTSHLGIEDGDVQLSIGMDCEESCRSFDKIEGREKPEGSADIGSVELERLQEKEGEEQERSEDKENSKEQERSKEKESSKEQERSKEMESSKEEERSKEKENSKEQERSKEKESSKEQERSKEMESSKEEERSKEKESSKEQERSEEKESSKEQERSKEKESSKEQEMSKEKESSKEQERSGEKEVEETSKSEGEGEEKKTGDEEIERPEETIHDPEERESAQSFLLIHNEKPVMRGTLIPTSSEDVVHGAAISQGNGKFLIDEILNTWENHDPDVHSEGTYIQWPMVDAVDANQGTHANQLATLFNGEGIMTGNAQTYLELGLKRGRKRKSDPASWKKNEKRRLANSGEGKAMKSPCRCRLKCYEKVTEDERKQVFDSYWSLGSPIRQWDFINSHLRFETEKKRLRVRNENSETERAPPIKRIINEKEVCKVMFENTLGVSQQVIKTVSRKRNENGIVDEDKRGRFGTKPTYKGQVITHIKLFPCRDTHYCRTGTERRWLHEDLSIPKMYQLYQTWCKEKLYQACIPSYYRFIFNTEFNLSFFKRKKDKCQTCEQLEFTIKSADRKRKVFRERDAFKEMDYSELMDVELPAVEPEPESETITNEPLDESSTTSSEEVSEEEPSSKEASEDEKTNLIRKIRLHYKEVEITRKLKLQKKVNSSHSRGKQLTVHFDLQQVFDTPYTNVGEVFYKRLLSSYNFVVVDVTNSEAYCFLWDEMNGKRGTNEMGTCFFLFCKAAAEKGVTKIDCFCDNCGGQNRNTPITAIIHHIAQVTGIDQITIHFLVKGHTENDADNLHSLIERGRQTAKLFLPSEWGTVIRSTPSESYSIFVEELQYNSFFDLKDLQSRYKNFRLDASGNTVLNWLRVSVLRVQKGSNYLEFKEHHGEKSFRQINLMQVGKGRRSTVKNYEVYPLVKAYSSKLNITKAKYNDLQDLCRGDKPVIPLMYHSFYKNLPHD